MKRDFGPVEAILATQSDFALDPLCTKSRAYTVNLITAIGVARGSSTQRTTKQLLAQAVCLRLSFGVETVHSPVLQDALPKETVDVDTDNVSNCCGCGWRDRCARVCRCRRIAASGGCPCAPSLRRPLLWSLRLSPCKLRLPQGIAVIRITSIRLSRTIISDRYEPTRDIGSRPIGCGDRAARSVAAGGPFRAWVAACLS